MWVPFFNKIRGARRGPWSVTAPGVWRCDTIGRCVVEHGSRVWYWRRGLWGQQDDFHVYRDAPRLHLTTQRVRLLEREKGRNSARWQVLAGLVEADAPLAEPGFSWALYYRYPMKPRLAGRRSSGLWRMAI
ncbi:MAG: hypothetical protein WDO18_00715 [Acidobacteriota bacterium]